MSYNFTAIEKKWQRYWLDNRSFRALSPTEAGDRAKAYILDMFPYPSGAGLHVGHPEGYTATDIVSRYLRMKGVNVLHPMGWDAFGLPAEQYAIKTNTHPRQTTEANIANFRRQIQMLGLSYDWDREVDTTDPNYYRWTQWIFLQLFNSYFDPIENRARSIKHLVQELLNENLVVAPDGEIRLNPTQEGLERIAGEMRIERLWRELDADEQRQLIDNQRLAYMDEIAVNWCEALGTVLSNEEVIDGKSEVGGYPVQRRPMRQWMLRITAYAQRLLDDLETLQWPESLKEMQRNWIGRSQGARIDFDLPDHMDSDGEPLGLTVFTTRPDTLYGATYLVLAPEHPLVDLIVSQEQRQSVREYAAKVAGRSERDRQADSKEKTGVFTGAYALNPINEEKIPVWIADYVLMGYGTGAIMAVAAHDQRDYEFAKRFDLPIRTVVRPAQGGAAAADKAFVEEGIACNSPIIDGLPSAEASAKIIATLERESTGRGMIHYKLRDWLFSRQRYWGEPFPILLDEEGNATALDESELPLTLPQMSDFKPTGTPQPPLSKAGEWLQVTRDGKNYIRETNTMPQWAGSCWYYLRYLDPKNTERLVDPDLERYWMPVDLYVGGVEHAVLHLLYARFWHKVLFDLGQVSTPEPFARLVNQGLILGEMEYHLFEDEAGGPVSAALVGDVAEEASQSGRRLMGTLKSTGAKVIGKRIDEALTQRGGGGFCLKSDERIMLDARSFKMSKSRGNVVNPDEIVRDYGADTFRLYEMYMGPLEAQKPWNTRDIVGMSRFCASVWRNLTGERDPDDGQASGGDQPATASNRITDEPLAEASRRQLHRAIKKVGEDIENLRFNTAIAELIKLNNQMTGMESVPRELAEPFVLLAAPFTPHLAEELWQRLGHDQSLSRATWPQYDSELLAEPMMEIPVQVNGKLRDKLTLDAQTTEADILVAALDSAKVRTWVEGKTIVKKLYVPGKLVNVVVR